VEVVAEIKVKRTIALIRLRQKMIQMPEIRQAKNKPLSLPPLFTKRK
jgi:hypothetical protein